MSGPDTSVIHAHSLSSDCSPMSQGLAPADKLGTAQKRRVTFPTTSASHAIAFLSLCPAKAGADQIKFQNQVCLGGSMVHSSTLATEC